MTSPRKFSRREVVVGSAAIAGMGIIGACDSRNGASAPTTPRSSAAETSTPSTSEVTTTTSEVVESTSTTSTQRGPAQFIDRGSITANQVALTFHASGDPALGVALLDLLRERATRVTVFAVGTWITAHPDLGRRIIDDGHELGNHTLTHQEMGNLTRAQVRDEIVGGGAAIAPILGSVGPWFRPSGIKVPTEVILEEAGRAGYARSIGYSLDSLDFNDPGGAAVVASVNNHVQSGDIVSLHFGHQSTIGALPAILRHLATNGLEPVTLGTLLN
ncbi:MAG: polysaccharide deacetylase family protein [Acidimicrobiales bacterium]